MSHDPFDNSFFHQSNNTERDSTIPRFYIRPLKNEFESNLKGHPVFNDKEYVEIIIPGNRGTTVDRQVTDEHRTRWPREYARFKANQEQAADGTPVEEWAAITRSEAEELKYFNVRTVEILANLADDALAKVVPMGGYALREKARRFMQQADGAAPADALAAKNAELEASMAMMQAQVDELLKRVATMVAPGPEVETSK